MTSDPVEPWERSRGKEGDERDGAGVMPLSVARVWRVWSWVRREVNWDWREDILGGVDDGVGMERVEVGRESVEVGAWGGVEEAVEVEIWGVGAGV